MLEELVASVREGGSILRGEKRAAKATTIDAPDVAEIRAAYELSQSQFAALTGPLTRSYDASIAKLREGRNHRPHQGLRVRQGEQVPPVGNGDPDR